MDGWGNGCIVVELALGFPKVGRMSVRGRRKGALPCASRAIKADAHASAVLHAARGDFDHVDLVAELQNDLLDDARGAEDIDLHARDSAVLGRPDV